MQGDAKVLLVSLDETPDGLRHELTRLGLEVIPCAFSDTEECLATDSPELLVLCGTRGSMELAMMVEDQAEESRAKMVIVAERKELAKLRGLNREVVVSLFASETTERVVAHRIESLVRRAIRRRIHGNSLAPTPSMAQRDDFGVLKSAESPLLIIDAPAPDFLFNQTSGSSAANAEIEGDEGKPTAPAPEIIASEIPPDLHLGHDLAKTAILGSGSSKKTAVGLPTRSQAPAESVVGNQPPASPPLAAARPKPKSKPKSKPKLPRAPEIKGEGDFDPMAATLPLAAQSPPVARSFASAGDTLVSTRAEAPPLRVPRARSADDDDAPSITIDGDPKEKIGEAPEIIVESAAENGADVDEERAPDSLVVMDDELLESLPPSDPPEAGQGMAAIPRMPPVPVMLPSSVPPELPAEAKAEAPPRAAAPPISMSSGLDVSSALNALDELEVLSVPPESDEAPSAQASSESPSDQVRAPGTSSVSAKQGDIPPLPEIGSALSALASAYEGEEGSAAARETRAAAETAAAADAPETQAVAEPVVLKSKVSPTASKASKGPSTAPAARTSSPSSPSGGRMSAAPTSKAPASLSREEVAQLLGEPKSQNGNKGLIWGMLGVVLMGGVGILIGLRTPKTQSPKAARETVPQIAPTAAQAPPSPVPAEVEKELPPPEEPQAAEPAPPAEGTPEAGGDEAPSPADAEAEKTPVAAAPVVFEPTMENPFRTVDTQMVSCEKLVSENPVEEAKDLVQASSLIWNTARQLIVSGKISEAHIKMCQAVALNPNSAALEGLAQLYLRGHSMHQALLWLDKADAARPGQLELSNLRGDIYSLMGEADKSREIWLKALGIDATATSRIVSVSSDYSVEAGRHLRRGDLIQAELWYRRAVILNPENLTGLIGLAKTFQKADESEYARAFAEMALKVSNIVPEVHVLLGELALAAGKQAEAKIRFERALEVRPGFFPAQRGLQQVTQE